MNLVNSIFLLTPEQLFICLKNCSFGPSHHRLRSHVMFISMQHVLLGFGWEVDGVILNAMLVFTLADLHFLFATWNHILPQTGCSFHHSPGNTSFWTYSWFPFILQVHKGGHTQKGFVYLCRSSQLNNLELLSSLPKFTPHLTQHSLSVFFE